MLWKRNLRRQTFLRIFLRPCPISASSFVKEVVDFIVEELEADSNVNMVDSSISFSYPNAEGMMINISAIYNWNTNKINVNVKSNVLIPVKTIEYSSDWK